MLSILTAMEAQQEEMKIYYFGDPMCSWCYGISEEFSKVADEYGSENIELVMGGLRAGGGEEWNQEFRDFLKHHWEDVGMKSGQPFKFDLLNLDFFDYDTEPACRAVVAAKEIDETLGLAFFKAVQKGFYVENKDPKKTDFYKPICEELGIDFQQFSLLFESEEMKAKTNAEFMKTSKMGVRGFPTVVVAYRGDSHIICRGYATYAQMSAKINEIIAKKK